VATGHETVESGAWRRTQPVLSRPIVRCADILSPARECDSNKVCLSDSKRPTCIVSFEIEGGGPSTQAEDPKIQQAEQFSCGEILALNLDASAEWAKI
jgi:hypothetical protein